MKARIAADGGISSTTDARIEELIQRADFLRRQYGADRRAEGAVLSVADTVVRAPRDRHRCAARG